MVKSLQILTDDLPNDIKHLEQTKQREISLKIQQQSHQAQPPAQQVKYTLSCTTQTERMSPKASKRLRSERSAELQRQMNKDFGMTRGEKRNKESALVNIIIFRFAAVHATIATLDPKDLLGKGNLSTLGLLQNSCYI